MAAVLGEANWYVERPGFWQGACGPAAAWAGGARRPGGLRHDHPPRRRPHRRAPRRHAGKRVGYRMPAAGCGRTSSTARRQAKRDGACLAGAPPRRAGLHRYAATLRPLHGSGSSREECARSHGAMQSWISSFGSRTRSAILEALGRQIREHLRRASQEESREPEELGRKIRERPEEPGWNFLLFGAVIAGESGYTNLQIRRKQRPEDLWPKLQSGL